MMCSMGDKLPQRPVQHVSEDKSKLVFQQRLPKHWIFRDLGTKNDYGIDSEVELVSTGGEVSGKIVKLQLKGREVVTFNADGKATVGGIKQSTLRYWLELSRHTHVLAALTDNSAERAYFIPVFWQAASAIDEGETTKSISFDMELELGTQAGVTTFIACVLSRPWNEIRAVEEILRELPALLYDYTWVYRADPWMINGRLDIFRRWLRNGREVMGPLVSQQQSLLFDEQHWVSESEKAWGDHIMYGTLCIAYTETFKLAFERVHVIAANIRRGRYYWERQAPECFRLVAETALPTKYDIDSIYKFIKEQDIPNPY